MTLDAQAGTGVIVESDVIRLDESYTDGRYVNEGQANAITSAMILNGTIQGEDINTSTTINAGKLQGGGTTITVCGIYGYSPSSYGVVGQSSSSNGVVGTSSSGHGVYGWSSTGYGVYGHSATSYAGYFNGKVHVTGTLTKGGGSFKIDHPLDPQSKYLQHSFVESPDMMNIYNGNVILDSKGEAVVELPSWFEALNQDFRYQLTAIGAPAPNLYIAEKISSNRFKIAGGVPGMEVSWQVTGIRHDVYANAHRVQVEEEKPPEERGKYLHPKEWGVPESMGIGYEEREKMMGEN